jgi:hypothetical protein
MPHMSEPEWVSRIPPTQVLVEWLECCRNHSRDVWIAQESESPTDGVVPGALSGEQGWRNVDILF